MARVWSLKLVRTEEPLGSDEESAGALGAVTSGLESMFHEVDWISLFFFTSGLRLASHARGSVAL